MTAKDFFFSLPGQAKPGMLDGIETLFHIDIAGEKGGQFSIRVSEGQMEVKEGLNGEAKCEIRSDEKHFFGVLSGEVNPMMAVLMNKITISNKEELFKHAKVLGFM